MLLAGLIVQTNDCCHCTQYSMALWQVSWPLPDQTFIRWTGAVLLWHCDKSCYITADKQWHVHSVYRTSTLWSALLVSVKTKLWKLMGLFTPATVWSAGKNIHLSGWKVSGLCVVVIDVICHQRLILLVHKCGIAALNCENLEFFS